MKAIIVLVGTVILSACASSPNLGKEQCLNYNWFEKGKADGSEGRTFKMIDKYIAECKQFKVKPNENEYVAGYLEGMKIYCTKENGYNDGIRAAKEVKTCPRESEYFVGYKEGLTIHIDDRERREVELLTRPDNDNGQRPGAGGSTAGGAP